MEAVALRAESRFPPRLWIPVLLAILLHLLLLPAPLQWPGKPRPPAPVEVVQIDPAKLAATRDAWKKQGVLLSDPQRPKEDVPPPKDPRYMSDRNVRVDRETVGAQTNVLPKPGAPGSAVPREESHPPDASARPRARTLPSLGNLGVPMRLNETARATPPARAAAPSRRRAPPGGGGASQWVDEKNLPTAGETMLNAQESVYYSFYSRLYESVAPLWQSRVNESTLDRPLVPGEYTTLAEIVLSKDGSLLEINQIRSSGVWQFDRAVETTWRAVRQFPNPPSGLISAEGTVRTVWTFRVQVSSSSQFRYAPPERQY